jgi:Asp/Glu/hydantoin racemase
VPLVDGIQAAVLMAEGLARMNPRKASLHSPLGGRQTPGLR